MSGLFISFEGGEGSGKTTQINKLAETLTQQGKKVITTREPGGTAEGDKVRDLIVQRDAGDWTPMAEILLLYAAREMHVKKTIRPALEDGKIVITDRFSDSTFAYQGYGHDLPLQDIQTVNDLVLGDLKPDITFILDIAPEDGLRRSEDRLSSEEISFRQTEDKFERMDVEFHEKLRNGFLDIAKKDPERCFVLDASMSIEALSKAIGDIVSERLL